MENQINEIFIKRNCVISTFITPWILGKGIKTPEEAKTYIKRGQTLNPLYYESNQYMIETHGKNEVYNHFMELLFSENNKSDELSTMIGEDIFKPWDCLSGIYQIEINEKMGLVGRPDGISKDHRKIVMVDNYLKVLTNNKIEEINIKLMSTMAVWRTKKGYYYLRNLNRMIELDFDENNWNIILNRIKEWSNDIE